MNPQDAYRIVLIVTAAECILALVGIVALSASLLMRTHEDPAVLTALVTTTGTLIGSLGTILVAARMRAQGGPTLQQQEKQQQLTEGKQAT